MKPTLKYSIITLALSTGFVSLTAEPKKTAADKGTDKKQTTDSIEIDPNIRVQLEYIEMPLLTMAELMDDEEATASDTILRARVAQLIKEGKATIMESQLLITRSGKKSTTESVREFIYPTEYEPPELPQTVYTSANETKSPSYDKSLATGPTPTAFETRNLGSTLEIEPTVSDDAKYIDLRISPEIVTHTKNTIYATWKDKRGTADIVMPEIYVLRINTAITVKNGKPCLLGVLSPKNEKGHVDYTRKVMVFIRANTTNIK